MSKTYVRSIKFSQSGKTYCVKSGTTTNLGALCFVDANKTPVVRYNATTLTSYGAGQSSTYPGWPVDSTKLTISYNATDNSNTFTVLAGSGIRYVLFYIRKHGVGENYWGAHDDLSVVDDTYPIQTNEGSSFLPYEDGGIIKESACIEKDTSVTVANSTATDIATLVTDFNNLLTALRNRSVLASS